MLNIFGQSPIKPFTQHMEKILEASSLIVVFFEAVFAEDWRQAEKLYSKMVSLENEADEMKREIRRHLPKNLFLPVSRGDLLVMLTLQDKIASKVRGVAGIIIGRKMQFPKDVQLLFIEFVTCCLQSIEKISEAISKLAELLEAGFRGSEVDMVRDLIDEVDSFENKSDALQREIRQKLFALESEISPIDMMFFYAVAAACGKLADRAQQVGEQFELLLAR